MPDRLMLPPAPVIRVSPERVRLDTKFVTGMQTICETWPGRVDCVLREGVDSIPFDAEYDVADLPFGLRLLPEGSAVDEAVLQEYDVIEASGDLHLDLHLAEAARRLKTRIVYVVEYDLNTRLQILRLDRSTSLPQKLKSGIWTLQQERLRRKAFGLADGLQVNGFPAFDSYSGYSDDTLLFLDNRMRREMFARKADLADRDARLRRGAPLRLINSGRLETMKGAQDLVPLARALNDRGVNFTLDIYGAGSLRSEISDGIARYELAEVVRLHEPVDFETELVPISRSAADVFLSCHRQSDPSCTYIEAMGCGLPVVGYANDMLARLMEDAKAGWTVPLGDVPALADRIAGIARDPDEIHRASVAALSYAARHDFETEFAKRRDHLIGVGGRA
ncbi:glycosyltransferase [Primorskyibacter sp. S87]|uniref:glycosyltransferase n=1 Tax=Primorskyibacter sp. S87 TaxID=3415126 RepID=UPI003C7E607F